VTTRAEAAVALAERLLRASGSKGRRAARLGRLVADDAGKRLSMAMADEVLRIRDQRVAARRFRALVRLHGVPSSLATLDRLLLGAGAIAAPLLPAVVMPLVRKRIVAETAGVILPAEDPAFARHVSRRRAAGIRLNVNLLGEAILGEDEAARRLAATIALAERDDVDYVSVKLSAICSQLTSLAFEQSVDVAAERLRILYDKATAAGTFVNLDMEEHKDLGLTTAAFMRVLDEPPLDAIDAGIVLQAYLPDSHGALARLGEWAVERHRRAGGTVKVRIVKGANLAMERVEAELRDWPQAPYSTKADVDASYKRLLAAALDPAYAGALRIGVGSHNLFDVAWAMTAEDPRVEIEMLEGMAEPQALAVRDAAGTVLLYAPVVREDEMDAAIAYLVRRLDENAAPENFLRHLLAGDDLDGERRRFLAAVDRAETVATAPRRTQDRRTEVHDTPADAPFRNEPDTDFVVPANREWLDGVLAAPAPAVDLPEIDVAAIDEAVGRAAGAGERWRALPLEERRRLVHGVGDAIARRRGDVLRAMAVETGKVIAEGDPEVSEGIDFARWYAAHAIDDPAFTPYSTVVVASPWNFPFAIPMGGVTAALAAGASVLLKPAPEAVLVGRLVAELCWDAGIPDDVVQWVPSPDGDVGRRLITHPGVDAVILTGSYETAQLFHSWRPDLRLHAETSGKNSLVITATADVDLAVRDLVRSAFGHAGQKCSAASLAVVVASVHDDPRFFRQLADAVASLPVGAPADLRSVVGPVIHEPEGVLLDALTMLQPGESWLVSPRRMGDSLWSPGVKVGVRPGSPFHCTEVFGPVLGVIRVAGLDEAIEVQNAVPFGLTGGIHALDPDEVDHWLERVEVGNVYVNRHTTGAIVRRQPFGGWKRSVVGPTVKAGGPHYVASLGRWAPASGVSYEDAWRDVYSREHDPSGLTVEANVLRYRPLPGGVAVIGATDEQLALARRASAITGTPMHTSLIEGLDRVRIPNGADDDVRRWAHERGIVVDDQPITPDGRVELLRWLREQAISRTMHRFGNVL
jgi:RHH-type proline utilization regulon transcriptional repressor/proline dehydrogenase/delta 1-pyrroline-5-carboxylate dehydrogenase